MVTRLDAQRLHIDLRVLPYLRIDKAVEEKCEQPLCHTGARKRPVLPNRADEPPARCLSVWRWAELQFGDGCSHGRFPHIRGFRPRAAARSPTRVLAAHSGSGFSTTSR